MAASPLVRLRRLCLSLPEAQEKVTWIPASPVSQDLIVGLKPRQYFVPPYVGPSGWIGAGLDRQTDWNEVEELVREGYVLVAPTRLVFQVRERGDR